jgi:hypothetical protein
VRLCAIELKVSGAAEIGRAEELTPHAESGLVVGAGIGSLCGGNEGTFVHDGASNGVTDVMVEEGIIISADFDYFFDSSGNEGSLGDEYPEYERPEKENFDEVCEGECHG